MKIKEWKREANLLDADEVSNFIYPSDTLIEYAPTTPKLNLEGILLNVFDNEGS